MIKSVYIENFGGIKNKEFLFDDGLNVIYGDNEAGKTTVCAFIKAMLYGMDNSRKTDIRSVARKRYMPLDGSCMSGSMEFLNYKITRVFGRTAKEDVTSIIDLRTGEKVDEEPGKLVFGLNADMFSDILFMEGYSAKISSGDEIITRITNLQSSMDENTSYHNAVKLLDNKKRKITGRSGIRLIENEIANLKNKVSDLSDEYVEYMRNKEILAENKAEYRDLKERKEYLGELSEKIHIVKKYKQYQNIKKECDTLKEEIGILENDDKAENEVPLPSDVYKIEQRYEESKKADVYSVSAVVLSIISMSGFFGLIYKPMYGMFFLLLISFVMFCVGKKVKKKRIYEIRKSLEDIFRIYGVDNAQAYEKSYNAGRERRGLAIRKLNEILDAKNVQLSALSTEISEIEADEDIAEFYNEADVVSELEDITDRLHELDKAMFILEQKISEEAVSPEMVYRQLEIKEKELEKMYKNLRCIELIRENLDEAFLKLQNSFAPRINKKAGEIFKKITAQKYEDVIINADFDVLVSGKNSITDSVYLSNGTLDAVYFSLKMAVSEVIFENRESFLLFDDAFIQYDDMRAEKAMGYLSALGRQVLYFTCQKRFNKNIDLIKDL